MGFDPEISRRDALKLGGGLAAAGMLGFGDTAPAAKVVAGSGADAMIVRHVKLSGSYKQIGQQLAALGKRHGAELGEVDPQVLAKRKAWFRAHYPELAERGEGVASVLGEKGDPFSVSYNDFVPGCSCSYYPPDRTTTGHALLSRNYDFSTGTLAQMMGQASDGKHRGFTADPYLLETHPTTGYATLMMVSYDLVAGCIDGMNEHGLGVALLADDQGHGEGRATGAQVGLSEIKTPRFFLERCRTVSECVALAPSIPYYFTFIACHYIVGDPSGHSAVIEWEPVSKKLHIVEGGKKPQVVTNHMLSAFPDGMSHPDDGVGGSFTRYKALRKAIDPRNRMSKAEIIAFHQSVMPKGTGAAMGQAVGRTLWHGIYDLEARTLDISFYMHDSPDGPLRQKRTGYLKFGLR
jgi:predicted choloylglycine hydrolase